MPRYDYICSDCTLIQEELRRIDDRDNPGMCKRCFGETKRKISFSTARDWFRPHVNEDITGAPIYIESKKQYKRICKENGVMARCLL